MHWHKNENSQTLVFSAKETVFFAKLSQNLNLLASNRSSILFPSRLRNRTSSHWTIRYADYKMFGRVGKGQRMEWLCSGELELEPKKSNAFWHRFYEPPCSFLSLHSSWIFTLILIRLFTLMRIRIWLPIMMGIHVDPDSQDWLTPSILLLLIIEKSRKERMQMSSFILFAPLPFILELINSCPYFTSWRKLLELRREQSSLHGKGTQN